VATREARHPAHKNQPEPRSPSRAARQLLQHCLNTAQQGSRRQLEPGQTPAQVRLTVGASGRLCARQESKGSLPKVQQRGKLSFGASALSAKIGNGDGKRKRPKDRKKKRKDRDKSFYSCLCLIEVRHSCEQPSLFRWWHLLPFQQA